MSSESSLVEIEPEVLSFRRPLNVDVVKCPLTIRNMSTHPILFKIKTTAPRTYCVRPNAGHIPAMSSRSVQVLLQPLEQDPPEDAKCRDKFLVLAAEVNEEAVAAVDGNAEADVWAIAEANTTGKSVERKLKVAFLPAQSSQSSAAPGTPSLASAQATPPTYSSNTGSSTTPSAAREQQKPVDLATSKPGDNKLMSKLEGTLKEKDEEIKRLQKLCLQYKDKSAKGSPLSVWSILVVAIIAFVLGMFFR